MDERAKNDMHISWICFFMAGLILGLMIGVNTEHRYGHAPTVAAGDSK